MSIMNKATDILTRSIVQTHKMEEMGKNLRRAADKLYDHEKRLVRLETLVEVATIARQLK